MNTVSLGSFIRTSSLRFWGSVGLSLAAYLSAPAASTVPLSEEKLTSILAHRLEGSIGYTFAQFSNMFLVRSQSDLPCAVALSASNDDIAKTELMPVFPGSYRPTLKEFLDAIALQTHAKWSYATESKNLQSSSNQPLDGVACFDFTPGESGLCFEVQIPAGWKLVDGGNRLMCVPPSFPVGVDFYEMGRYSFAGDAAEGMKGIREAVALDWATRAKKDASRSELKEVSVGSLSTLYFETTVKSRLGGDLIWRQWVFSSRDRCYFVISTLDEGNSTKLLPDVVKILHSFKENRKPNSEPSDRPQPKTRAGRT